MSRLPRLLLPLLLCLAALPAPARALPDTIVLSAEAMAQTRQAVLRRDPAVMPAYEKLIKEAERAVTAPAETVIFKPAPPPGGTLHDYWSLAPNWWPDPESRTGLPYRHIQGRRNPEADSDNYDRSRLRRMSSDALTLALAWYLTGDERYAGKGTALVWSWCCDSETRTNPHLRFGRARPGLATGTAAGIIETRMMIRVAEAARILAPSNAWSQVVSRKVKAWFGQYLDWLRHSPFGRQQAVAADHQATWYDAQLAVFALYADNPELARVVLAESVPRRIIAQIEANGAMPRELDRSRSRHFTYFNLQALFTLAGAAEAVGIDLWHWRAESGASIRKALDYAAPYLARSETWPFGPVGTYDPFAFTPLFHRAAMVYKDPRYLQYLDALPPEWLRKDRAQLFY